jgi:ATP-dependent RNA helicase SUPV3L1/SUV3
LKFIEIPFEHDNAMLLASWGSLIELYLENKYILNCFPIPETTSAETLEEMEQDYRILELLYSFVRLIGYTDLDLDIVVKAKERTSGCIVDYLKNNKKKLEKRCTRCGRKMKWSNPHNICNKCYFAGI